MSSPFLTNPTNAGVSALLTSGTQRLNVSTITSQALIQGLPVCTNTSKQLISRQIQQADLGFSVLSNPYVGTLQVSDLKTDDFASIDTTLGTLSGQTQNFTATAGDTDFGNTNLSDINIITSSISTTGRVNLIQQASMGAPIAGRNIFWSQTSDGRVYITDPSGTQNRVAYSTDAPGGGGDTITNGTGESVVVNVNGSILYDGGCIEYVATATGSGTYTALPGQKNIIVDLVAITSVSLPVSPVGTVFYVRREYALQGGEVFPASVFSVSAVGSTIEGLASVNITAYSGARFMFIGTKWVIN